MPITRLFVNALTHLDVSLMDPELGLLGMTWLADVTLAGELDAQGMVLDFGAVKKVVKQRIDQQFDHRLLIPADFAGCAFATDRGTTRLEWRALDGRRWMQEAPEAAVRTLAAERVDAAALERAMIEELSGVLPQNVQEVRIRLRPEACADGVFFRYSHGLKRHDGNCQRIAHGHRSRLEIRRNGVRDGGLEQEWARRWRDIYIAQREDLAEAKDGRLVFQYRSCQGAFRLELPADRCYLVDRPSTIENLAGHLAERLKATFPDDAFEVRLFEGVDKGALVETG